MIGCARRSRRAIPALVLTLAAAIAPSAAARSRTGQQVRQQLTAIVGEASGYGIPGGVVGVRSRAVGFRRAFGLAAPGQPMSVNDHFRIGSVTKTFTATVILELVDRHKLRLGDRISRWEPRLPYAKRITIRMLLDMRSGIWDEGGAGPNGNPSLLTQWLDDNCAEKNSTKCGRYWSPQSIVNLAIRQGAAAYLPGSVYYYSDTNYMILGIIARKVTGHPLGWLVRHLVLAPLHLRNTSFPTTNTRLPAPGTEGYASLPDIVAPARYTVLSEPSPSVWFGAGNMVSTLGDLEVWARALATGELLEPRTQRLRLKLMGIGAVELPLTIPPVDGLTFGPPPLTALAMAYGLGIIGAGGMLGHDGVLTIPGYSADVWYIPKVSASVVVLMNSVTQCQDGPLLSSATATSLAETAFSRDLNRISEPGFLGVTCPKPSG